ncbi:hypothetical protein [Azospirillum sp. B506]|uniref:hypothetical protein n=1 Tax=Azospirillum sp. B506 TaxID=137721 RepID=UPI0011DE2FA1|nr:hypothetical protein [Azospirillum sp. B506]
MYNKKVISSVQCLGDINQISPKGVIFICATKQISDVITPIINENFPENKTRQVHPRPSGDVISIESMAKSYQKDDIVLIGYEYYKEYSISFQIRGIPHSCIYNAMSLYNDVCMYRKSRDDQRKNYREKYRPSFDVSERISFTPNFVALVGDSTLYHLPSICLSQMPNTYNLGVPHLSSEALMERVDFAVEKGASAVAISVGIIDLTAFVLFDPGELIDRMRQVADKLESRHIPCAFHTIARPNFSIPGGGLDNRMLAADHTGWVNDVMRSGGLGRHAAIIDVDAMLSGEKGLREEYCSFDYVHTNGEGYLVWGRMLREWYDSLGSGPIKSLSASEPS